MADLDNNLAHDPSRYPASAMPASRRPTAPRAQRPGVLDVVRSIDTSLDAASTSRAYAGAQAARSVRVTPKPGVMTKVQAGHRALARANPAMMVASGAIAASSAYNGVRAAGGTKGQAVAAGAAAGAPMAGAAVAPSIIGRAAPAVAAGLSKLALPLTVATATVGAVRGGMAAARDGKSTARIAGEAALGGADALSFGLASKAWKAAGGDPTSLAIVEQARQNERAQRMVSASKAPSTPADASRRAPAPSDASFREADKEFRRNQSAVRDEQPAAGGRTYKDVWDVKRPDGKVVQAHRRTMDVRTAKDGT